MMILKFTRFIFRVIFGAIKNYFVELKALTNEGHPTSKSFRERLKHAWNVYFLPLTASWRGVKKAWAKGFI